WILLLREFASSRVPPARSWGRTASWIRRLRSVDESTHRPRQRSHLEVKPCLRCQSLVNTAPGCARKRNSWSWTGLRPLLPATSVTRSTGDKPMERDRGPARYIPLGWFGDQAFQALPGQAALGRLSDGLPAAPADPGPAVPLAPAPGADLGDRGP